MLRVNFSVLSLIILLLVSCKQKQIVSEQISSHSDSTKVFFYENEISKKEQEQIINNHYLNPFLPGTLIQHYYDHS